MQKIAATSVGIIADFDHGEGWVVFTWSDHRTVREELRIRLDGHCSRRMPFHSGTGPPEFVALRRGAIQMRFTADLARRLRLERDVEIAFDVSDEQFVNLRRLVAFFSGRPG